MTLPYPIIAPLFLSSHVTKAANYFLSAMSYKTQVTLVLGAYPLGLFIGAILLGQLSDTYGKRITLLFGLFFSSCTQLISGYLIIHKFYDGLLITRFISGLFEGNIAIARAAFALICTNEASKRKHFGRTNAALTLGWAVGPLLGYFFSDSKIFSFFKYSTPFYISGVLTLSLFTLTFFKFKEPQKTATINFVKNNSEKLAKSLFEKKLLILFLCSLFITLGVDAFYQFLPIFLATQFTYSSLIISISISIVAISNTVTNIILIPIVGKFITTVDSLILFPLLLGLCLLIIGTNKYQFSIFFILPFIGASIALTMTNMTVLVSTNSSQLIQGKLMGLLLSQRTLGTALISFSMIPLVNYNYKAPFIAGGLLLLTSVAIMVLLNKKKNLFTLMLPFKRRFFY